MNHHRQRAYCTGEFGTACLIGRRVHDLGRVPGVEVRELSDELVDQLTPSLRLAGSQALHHAVVDRTKSPVGSVDIVTLPTVAVVPEHEPREADCGGGEDFVSELSRWLENHSARVLEEPGA
jgi:hypothetical protein